MFQQGWSKEIIGVTENDHLKVVVNEVGVLEAAKNKSGAYKTDIQNTL